MTCGGCGSPRPAGKEQKKSYRAQKRILLSSSPGVYYNSLCLVTGEGVPFLHYIICDMIKGNESDVGNINFELQA